MKKFLIFIIFLFSICFVQANEQYVMPSQIGKIVNLEYIDVENNDFIQTKQVAFVKLLKGKSKNQIIVTENNLTGNPNYDITLKKGMKVLLHVDSIENELIYSIESIYRSNTLFWLSLLFCGLLIYVGKIKGLYSLVSIIFTVILITNILSPMILAGINPITSTIIICLLSTAITMYLVGGFNRKSSAATIGCILSIIIAGILSLITVNTAHLTGFTDEQSLYLYATHPKLNFVNIVISTMLLATLGAVMDVSMSIASTINEIYTVDNTKTVKELFKCGMNVGRDIIGTMANTLILVYLGSSLPLILLISNLDLQKFINLNAIVTEISAAIIGSCAIIICVPVTALVASELIKNMPKQIEFPKIN